MSVARIACLLLLGFCLPLLSEAQSLGSVAKKERERREKNKQEGVAAREFSEKEIFGETKEEETSEGETVADAESSDEAPSGEVVIPGASSKPTQEVDRLDEESRERQRNEAEWRSRASDARSRIADARERVRALEELFLGPEEYYVDENGRTVIGSTEQLQQMTREAKEDLAAAEASWKQLQEEARRSGIPPGWLR
ncbi:MAG TPA: hypothetical protein VLK65_26500 [Vicinamibacteria bacterium]|nr:hypothetical protein [Vicinamibacteria bacterium]